MAPWPRDSVNPRYHNAYLVIGEWMYWSMPGTIAEQVVINRAVPDIDAPVPSPTMARVQTDSAPLAASGQSE